MQGWGFSRGLSSTGRHAAKHCRKQGAAVMCQTIIRGHPASALIEELMWCKAKSTVALTRAKIHVCRRSRLSLFLYYFLACLFTSVVRPCATLARNLKGNSGQKCSLQYCVLCCPFSQKTVFRLIIAIVKYELGNKSHPFFFHLRRWAFCCCRLTSQCPKAQLGTVTWPSDKQVNHDWLPEPLLFAA